MLNRYQIFEVSDFSAHGTSCSCINTDFVRVCVKVCNFRARPFMRNGSKCGKIRSGVLDATINQWSKKGKSLVIMLVFELDVVFAIFNLSAPCMSC